MRNIKATADSEAGVMPSTELIEAMGKYNEELVNAGIMLSGEGIKPSSQGVRVAFEGEDRTVTNGPFANPNEIVAGFWIWQVKDMDEAIAWVKRAPTRCSAPVKSRSAQRSRRPTSAPSLPRRCRSKRNAYATAWKAASRPRARLSSCNRAQRLLDPATSRWRMRTPTGILPLCQPQPRLCPALADRRWKPAGKALPPATGFADWPKRASIRSQKAHVSARKGLALGKTSRIC